MSKELLYTFLTFLTVQSAVWFQTNGQFVWSWFKDQDASEKGYYERS